MERIGTVEGLEILTALFNDDGGRLTVDEIESLRAVLLDYRRLQNAAILIADFEAQP